MLVLSRQVDQTIIIDDNIAITILAIEGDRVKLGVRAPREVIVLREELWLATQEQNQIAKQPTGSELPASFEALRHLLTEAAAQ